ncbi:hypothetical protein D3C87_34840 [compost metagenome]
MKKLLLVLSCSAFLGLHAQTPPDISSLMQPWKSNGYISWNTKSGQTYKVKIYQLKSGNYNLISTSAILKSRDNYFRFSSSELVSADLFYTISEYTRSGTLVNESEPAAIGMPMSVPICYVDCNGLREAYRISLMQRFNGAKYLSATDDAGIYYQAINDISYVQYHTSHPYRRLTANGTGNQLAYTREHIRITQDLVDANGPYYDANHAIVNADEGWLVAKKMDKYMHYNGAITSDYLSTIDLCDANIGLISTAFNNHLVASSMIAPGTSITGDHTYFLSSTPPNSTTYVVPNIPLECSTMANGGSGPSVPGPGIGEFMDDIELCFDMASSDSGGTQVECLVPDGPIGGGLGGTISGVTFESMNANNNYRLSVINNSGTTGVLSETGKFTPGLYRINTFLTDGNIVPTYRVLGKPASTAVAPTITITIAPNPIVSNKLKFSVTTNKNVVATILVQKLDGSTIYTESVNLVKNNAFNKELDVIGDVPYNQVRVSVILTDGTVIQQTALTQ